MNYYNYYRDLFDKAKTSKPTVELPEFKTLPSIGLPSLSLDFANCNMGVDMFDVDIISSKKIFEESIKNVYINGQIEMDKLDASIGYIDSIKDNMLSLIWGFLDAYLLKYGDVLGEVTKTYNAIIRAINKNPDIEDIKRMLIPIFLSNPKVGEVIVLILFLENFKSILLVSRNLWNSNTAVWDNTINRAKQLRLTTSTLNETLNNSFLGAISKMFDSVIPLLASLGCAATAYLLTKINQSDVMSKAVEEDASVTRIPNVIEDNNISTLLTYATANENGYSLYYVDSTNSSDADSSDSSVCLTISMCYNPPEISPEKEIVDNIDNLYSVVEFGNDLTNYTISVVKDQKIGYNDIIGYINKTPIKSILSGIVTMVTDKFFIIKNTEILDNLIDADKIGEIVKNLTSDIILQSESVNTNVDELTIEAKSDEVLNSFTIVNNCETFIRDCLPYDRYAEFADNTGVAVINPVTKSFITNNNINFRNVIYDSGFVDDASLLRKAYGEDIKEMGKDENVKTASENNTITELGNSIMKRKEDFTNVTIANYKSDKCKCIGSVWDYCLKSVYKKLIKNDTFVNNNKIELESNRNVYISKLYNLLTGYIKSREKIEPTVVSASLKKILVTSGYNDLLVQTQKELKEIKELNDSVIEDYYKALKLSKNIYTKYNEVSWPSSAVIYINNIKHNHYLFYDTTSSVVEKSLNSMDQELFSISASSYSKIDITDIRYWLKYCAMATLVGCAPNYWAVGIPAVVAGTNISMPVVYLPIVFIKGEVSVLIGLGICGMVVYPMLYYMNFMNNSGTVIPPLNLAISTIKKLIQTIANNSTVATASVCKPISSALNLEIANMDNEINRINSEIVSLKNSLLI